jgi:hypothetical protein
MKITCADKDLENLVEAIYNCEYTKEILERAKFRAKHYTNDKAILVKWGDTTKSDVDTGVIFLDARSKSDNGVLLQGLVFELVNMTNMHRFRSLNNLARATLFGQPLITEEEFVKTNEEVEFEGRTAVIKAFEKCGKAWKCTECIYDLSIKDMTFKNWFDNKLDPRHKENLARSFYALRANQDPVLYKRLLIKRAFDKKELTEDQYKLEIAKLPSSTTSSTTSTTSTTS